MVKYALACLSISSLCFGVVAPWSSGGSIESDLTVKNPEKFAQGKLIPQYLEKAEKYLSGIVKDRSLDVATIQKQKRDAKKDKSMYDAVNDKLGILTSISDHLNALMRRLQFATGDEYYTRIKTKYFADIKGHKNTTSDPFNILKIDAAYIDTNRDCLYRFLSWNFPGQKTAVQVRAMSPKDIMTEIQNLKQAAFKKGLNESSKYVLLVREIGVFLGDELAKEEYDAFVDGVQALNRLVIPDAKTRKTLSDKADKIYNELLTDAKMKLRDAAAFVKQLVPIATSVPTVVEDRNWSCPICFETQKKDTIITPCKHVFHRKCLEEWVKKNSTCPMCRRPI